MRVRLSLLRRSTRTSLATFFPALFVSSVHCFASLSINSLPCAVWNTRGGSLQNIHQRGLLSTPTSLSSTSTSATTTSASSESPLTETTALGETMTPTEKLQALRAQMKELGIDVYLVPSDDPHLSGT